MKNTVLKIAVLSFAIAVLMSGCSSDMPDETEATSLVTETGISETEENFAEISESEAAESTTSVTSETVIFCDESIFSETTETEPPYIEDGKPPVVMSAEELYGTYPVKLIYAERQDVSDKVKTEILQEDIYNSEGVTAVEFFAEYPVLFGYDETVCRKINDTIREYVDGNFERMQEFAEELEISDSEEIDFMIANNKSWAEMTINMDGTYFDGFGYDINGNIFTVYFAYNFGYFISAHGSEIPVPMMFDLRTGDKINFSELIGNKDKMNEAFAETERRGELLHGTVPFGERNADEISEFMKPPFYVTDTFYTDEKIAVMDGCIGFFLAPYENGSFADGVRFWRLPASEFIPYMNEKGKSLFEGYASAETTAPNVIEYKGKRWFDNIEWIPNIVDRENLTDYDREFILIFENARNTKYYLGQE